MKHRRRSVSGLPTCTHNYLTITTQLIIRNAVAGRCRHLRMYRGLIITQLINLEGGVGRCRGFRVNDKLNSVIIETNIEVLH